MTVDWTAQRAHDRDDWVEQPTTDHMVWGSNPSKRVLLPEDVQVLV